MKTALLAGVATILIGLATVQTANAEPARSAENVGNFGSWSVMKITDKMTDRQWYSAFSRSNGVLLQVSCTKSNPKELLTFIVTDQYLGDGIGHAGYRVDKNPAHFDTVRTNKRTFGFPNPTDLVTQMRQGSELLVQISTYDSDDLAYNIRIDGANDAFNRLAAGCMDLAASQPNIVSAPPPDAKAIENTLEKLREKLAQSTKPNEQKNDIAALSADQRAAIGDHIRECWSKDAGALDIDKQRVMLTVTTDASGMARKAVVAGSDQTRMADPQFRIFAERAIQAVLNPLCSNLPLPNIMLGKANVLTFRFSP